MQPFSWCRRSRVPSLDPFTEQRDVDSACPSPGFRRGPTPPFRFFQQAPFLQGPDSIPFFLIGVFVRTLVQRTISLLVFLGKYISSESPSFHLPCPQRQFCGFPKTLQSHSGPSLPLLLFSLKVVPVNVEFDF